MHVTPSGGDIEVTGVVIRTPDGVTIEADLRVPAGADRPGPAVILSPPGPAAVIDQSVVVSYAERLARAGYVTLAVEPRNFGRSGGSPRQHFDMHERLRDLQVAVTYLTRRGDVVDPARIATLGTSAGGSFAVALAGHDLRIRAFVSVCGGFFSPASARKAMSDEVFEALQRSLLRGVERYHVTGELDYQPVVTPDGNGAYLAGIEPRPTEPYDYYGTERGASTYFENRITTISMYSMTSFDFVTPADWMGSRAGLLIEGSDDVYVPAEGTAEVYARLTGPKDLITVPGADHTAFYDQEPYLSTAVDAAVAWFDEHV
jgi:fermentation-respiration switch protein FrsA (DUF1100 family)